MTTGHANPGTPSVDDPQVAAAMDVYDSLTGDEQREVFRTMYRAVAAYSRTSDIDHLVRFAESIKRMVRFEAQPGFQQARREGAKHVPGEGIDIGEAIRRLRE